MNLEGRGRAAGQEGARARRRAPPGTVDRGGLATPPATGPVNQRGRVSNRDFPAPYRSGLGGSGRRPGGRSSGGQHSTRSSRSGLRNAARSLLGGGAEA